MTVFKRLVKSKEKKIGLTVMFDPAVTAQLQNAIEGLNKAIDDLKNKKLDLRGDPATVKKYNGLLDCINKKG